MRELMGNRIRVIATMKSSMIVGVAVALTAGAVSCTDAQDRRERSDRAGATVEGRAVAESAVPDRPVRVLTGEERAFYQDVARTAWAYMEAYYQPATGFVNATPDWSYTTVWDVGGQFLSFLSARDLGLLAQEEYDQRTRRMLETLERAQLFGGAAYNKVYSTTDGSSGDGAGGGQGWSATDLGRLLVALHVVAQREPQHAAQAERVVRRLDMSQIVQDGYVHGRMIGSRGQPWTFQEGRIGYEQYVARGFAAWGADVQRALNLHEHAQPVDVFGVALLADGRGLDRLLSDPFIMYGLELGMPADVRELAHNVLRAQEARYRETGQITIVNEDAVAVPPYHFYYYCVYCNGRPFIVDTSIPGNARDEPRWVSTKAAFGWHALLPDEYTRKALDHVVAGARHPERGFASGVFEKTGESTETYDINTASVLLEVANYQLRGGRPLIQP
jgi:hypothetical protein